MEEPPTDNDEMYFKRREELDEEILPYYESFFQISSKRESVFTIRNYEKTQILEFRYRIEDIERFFLKEIESRIARKVLGFLDPWRIISNDWDISFFS